MDSRSLFRQTNRHIHLQRLENPGSLSPRKPQYVPKCCRAIRNLESGSKIKKGKKTCVRIGTEPMVIPSLALGVLDSCYPSPESIDCGKNGLGTLGRHGY